MGQKAEWDKMSTGKNVEWKKRRMGQNVEWKNTEWDKRSNVKTPNGTKRRMGQNVDWEQCRGRGHCGRFLQLNYKSFFQKSNILNMYFLTFDLFKPFSALLYIHNSVL
jgi:hypothetical protein